MKKSFLELLLRLRTHPLLTVVALWSALARPCHANSAIVAAGNALQILMPLGAGAASLAKHDETGLWQLAKSQLATVSITYGLKYVIHSTGPDGQQHSFPSGHTAVTFRPHSFCKSVMAGSMACPPIS